MKSSRETKKRSTKTRATKIVAIQNTIRDVRGSLLANAELGDKSGDYLRGVIDACEMISEALSE